jgi:hypothetical protein
LLDRARPAYLYLAGQRRSDGPARGPVRVVLGSGGSTYGYLDLDARGEPLPKGLEALVQPLPVAARPGFYAERAAQLLPALALSAHVTSEAWGHRCLITHGGRIVGKIILDPDLEPLPEARWRTEFDRSEWRWEASPAP